VSYKGCRLRTVFGQEILEFHLHFPSFTMFKAGALFALVSLLPAAMAQSQMYGQCT
jgi:hypothetical protein